MSIVIRDLIEHWEYDACVRLQKETWGETFSEIVPQAILQVSQRVGGVTAGAFEEEAMVGFVFGLTGLEGHDPVHWSDMLAVRASHRNRGIGEQLKWYQRRVLMQRGVNRVRWTFDPLDCKNAHLNFNRLGVIAREYVVDMYGQTDSPLHAGIGTDRLVVTWDLDSPRVVASQEKRSPFVDQVDARIEIPGNIHEINKADPDKARWWRERTRSQFQGLLADCVVAGFVRGEAGGYYALTSTSNFET